MITFDRCLHLNVIISYKNVTILHINGIISYNAVISHNPPNQLAKALSVLSPRVVELHDVC